MSQEEVVDAREQIQARREITKEVRDAQVLFETVPKVPRDSRIVQSLNMVKDCLIPLLYELKD